MVFEKGRTSWNKGIPMSEEARNKLSISKLGCIPWNKGKKTGLIPRTAFKKGHVAVCPFKKGRTPWNKGKKFPQFSGENNPNWKNGIKKSHGYIYFLQPFHPFCTSQGYVKRSHLVIEKIIGRFLKKGEVVHHINKKLNDDRPKNLILFKNHSEHMKFHSKFRK